MLVAEQTQTLTLPPRAEASDLVPAPKAGSSLAKLLIGVAIGAAAVAAAWAARELLGLRRRRRARAAWEEAHAAARRDKCADQTTLRSLGAGRKQARVCGGAGGQGDFSCNLEDPSALEDSAPRSMLCRCAPLAAQSASVPKHYFYYAQERCLAVTAMTLQNLTSTGSQDHGAWQGGAATREEDRQAAADVWDVAAGRQDMERRSLLGGGF